MSWSSRQWRNEEGSLLAGAIGALAGAIAGAWFALKGLGWLVTFLPASASIAKTLMVLLLVGFSAAGGILVALFLAGCGFMAAFAVIEALRTAPRS